MKRRRTRWGSGFGVWRLAFMLAVSLLVAGCSRPERAAADRTATPDEVALPRGEPAAVRPFDTPPLALGKPRVVFLGDSLTAGYGLPKEQSVPSLVQKRLDAEGYDYEIVNHGVSGDTSAGGVSRLDWALDGDVRVLVLELGANDGLRGLPVESTKANLSDIISRAKARGVTVLLTGMEAPPNHGPAYTLQFRQLFADLARQHKVAFVPFYLEGVAGNPALNISDGIHPNAAGAAVVQNTIWTALQPLLERDRSAALVGSRRGATDDSDGRADQ
jgi:acyl-CoA thioesterase-1